MTRGTSQPGMGYNFSPVAPHASVVPAKVPKLIISPVSLQFLFDQEVDLETSTSLF